MAGVWYAQIGALMVLGVETTIVVSIISGITALFVATISAVVTVIQVRSAHRERMKQDAKTSAAAEKAATAESEAKMAEIGLAAVRETINNQRQEIIDQRAEISDLRSRVAALEKENQELRAFKARRERS